MAIRRGPIPADSFTIINNAWLRDSALSWKAKGLLAYIASHAAGHTLSTAQILAEGTDGRDAVRAGLVELEAAGYLRRIVKRGEGGKVEGTDYELTEPGSTGAGKAVPGADQGEQGISAGGAQCGKSGAGEPAGKKTTPKKTTEDHSGTADAVPADTAQTILRGFIDWLKLPAQGPVQLSKRAIGIYAKQIKTLLDEGFDAVLIKKALAEMARRGRAGQPVLLHGFVVDVQTKPVSGAPAGASSQAKPFVQQADEYKTAKKARQQIVDQVADELMARDEAGSLGVAEALIMAEELVTAHEAKLSTGSSDSGYIDVELINVETHWEVTGS